MVYAVLIGFYASIWKFFATGASNLNVRTVKVCSEHWWENLLYINNFSDAQLQYVSEYL